MKRYGDNLPSNQLDASESESGEQTHYLAGNCAVRQDMVSFLMPAEIPNEPKPRNIFSFFKLWKKKENGKLHSDKS